MKNEINPFTPGINVIPTDVYTSNAIITEKYLQETREQVKKLGTLIHYDSVTLNAKKYKKLEKLCEFLAKKYFIITSNMSGMKTLIMNNCLIQIHHDCEIKDRMQYIAFNINASNLEDMERTKQELEKLIQEYFPTKDYEAEICWYYTTQGRMDVKNIPVPISYKVFKEAYPYLENFDSYFFNYLESNESILILHGTPGTGKTKLITEIMKRMCIYSEKNLVKICYANSEEVLKNEQFYFDFASKGFDMMVLEDVDYSLMSRKKNENNIIKKILTSSDGIIPIDKKKIIITTNLNMKDIDQAIIRNGRCYDNVNTRCLNQEEVNNLLKEYNKFYKTKHKIELLEHFLSLADVYKLIKQKEIDSKIVKKQNIYGNFQNDASPVLAKKVS